MTATGATLQSAAAQMARGAGFEAYARLIEMYAERLGEPWLGRTRAVFDRRDGYVIKIPINGEGVLDNTYEAHHADPDIPLATCRLEEVEGCEILVMEQVTVWLGERAQLPDWVDWVDCAQVGYTADGRLVAYDL